MAVDPFEPYGAIAYHRVELGCGREATQAPDFLVPAATEDPGTVGKLLGIGRDQRLRFLERLGLRQVEGQRAEADAHHVNVCVEQAGHHHAAPAILAKIDVARQFLAALEDLLDPAIVTDEQGDEALDLAFFVESDALDVVEQRVGVCRRTRHSERQRSQRDPNHLHLFTPIKLVPGSPSRLPVRILPGRRG